MAPRPGSPTPTLAEHAARCNLTSFPSLFLPPAAPPPSGRATIGQQSPRRAASLASCRGPGRDTPTGFPMAGLGWTGWGEGDGMGRGGFPRPGPPGGREGPHAGDRETAGWGSAGWHAPGSPRPHAPGTSAPLPVPADLGGRKVGKGTGSEGPGFPFPPPNHLSPTPGPGVLPGDTVFSRMVISSMAEVAALTPPKTTAGLSGGGSNWGWGLGVGWEGRVGWGAGVTTSPFTGSLLVVAPVPLPSSFPPSSLPICCWRRWQLLLWRRGRDPGGRSERGWCSGGGGRKKEGRR